jgi:hypothetical protein
MKHSSVIVLGSALAVVLLAACESDGESNARTKSSNRFGYRGSAGGTQYAQPTPNPEGSTNQAPPEPVATPTPPPAPPAPTPRYEPAPSRDVSYGTPVPGKPGFVTSPHSPYAGYVDVRGFPPGTEVKCPYSGKIFLVP